MLLFDILAKDDRILNRDQLDARWPEAGKLDITGIVMDSREVRPGVLFAAIRGLRSDGHDFLYVAAEAGAAAAIVETVRPEVPIPQIQVENVRHILGPLCARFYGTSAHDGTAYLAVTGTDGKSSTNQMITYLAERAGLVVGRIGTPGISYPGYQSEHGSHTTPDSPVLHNVFAKMRDRACDIVTLEASSHALDQERLNAIPFRAAAFTNLSHEHLDYHHTMENYALAKRRLFEMLEPEAVAVLNHDDEQYDNYRAHTRARVVSYGQAEDADYRISRIEDQAGGLRFELTVNYRRDEEETRPGIPAVEQHFVLETRVHGSFNAYNMAGALAMVCKGLGVSLADAVSWMAQFEGVPGRMQAVREGQDFGLIVDFAVTPRALEQALSTVQSMKHRKIWVVTSSAGERDKTRRPRLSQIMNEYADHVILTSDLVFGENIVSIVKDLAEYVDKDKLQVIYSRHDAMRYAIGQAKTGDIVLICGLGDIRAIIINGKSYYHDDYEYARHCVTERITREILHDQVREAGEAWIGYNSDTLTR